MTHLSVQTEPDSFFEPALLRSKTSTTFDSSIEDLFIGFKQRLYSDILLFIFSSTAYIIKFSIHLCSKLFFVF
jgi:hypothetical protein